MADRRVLVLDNGGSHLKIGFSTDSTPRVVPNTAARIKRQLRTLLGEETETLVKDFSQLTYVRPVDRGYIVDAPTQSALWQHAFPSLEALAPEETTLLLTSPPFAMRTVEATLGELAFESHGFAGLSLEIPAVLAAQTLRGDPACPVPLLAASGTGVVVDCGYSATHVVPLLEWRPVPTGIRRLDVGGKALTNYLKDAVSYRQYNMMDDTFLVNQVKERLCYVSQSFDVELEVARRLTTPVAVARAAASAVSTAGLLRAPMLAGPLAAAARACMAAARTTRPADDGVGPGILREFVLPDFVKVTRGYVRGASDDPALADRAGGAGAASAAPAQPSHRGESGDTRVKSEQGAGAAPRPQPEAAGAKRKRHGEASTTKSGSSAARRAGRTGAAAEAKGKRQQVEGAAAGGEEEEEEDDGVSSLSESDDDDDDEDEDEGKEERGAWLSKRDGEYSGGSGGSAAAPPRRSMGHRAARAGVTALTRALRSEGALAAGDEDEDAGGAVVEARPRGGGSAGGAGGGGADDDLQILAMNGERISVPELLFRPVDAGLAQAGLPEAIAEAIDGAPFALHAPLWASIFLTGGTARLPGLHARLERELRALAPAGLPVAVYTAPDPILAAWTGGARFAQAQPDALARRTVSRATYAEEGVRALRKAFRLRLPAAPPPA